MLRDISEFDFIFLSFDEPNAEELYADLLNNVPWAKRVHGIKGFDSAHRACAEMADTHFFITVDGDNRMDPRFLEQKIEIGDHQDDHAWTWAGRNHINGLVYGNGGLKLWSKTFVMNMNSHEHSQDDANKVDFCWNERYHEVFGTWSTTITNASPYQAWRAGYREGVKMSLDAGLRVRPADFARKIWIYNMHKLLIWCSIGADVPHGVWSIYGARLGVHDVNLTEWDYTNINDYSWFKERWTEVHEHDPVAMAQEIGDNLRKGLNIDIADLDAQQSRFFKNIYINPPRPLLKYGEIANLAAIPSV